MIIRKSGREIDLLKEAGRITALAIAEVGKAIRPGVSTYELDKLAEKVIRDNGATPSFLGYDGFKGTLCTSINEVVIHGIPSKRQILKEGDIISIDCGACYQGYNGDSAYTYTVGKVTPEVLDLLEVTRQALFEGLSQAKPENRIGDISYAIENYVKSHGYSSPYDYTGHGVGQDIHEDPMVPNYGIKGHGPVLKEGMVIAVEPMVHMGRPEVFVKSDGWTVVTKDHSWAAHFEHTILITKDGYQILTTTGGEQFG